MNDFPVIERDANKYTRGSLLVFAGSSRYPGAAVLAAMAAARSGAGYVTLAVPATIASIAQSHLLTVPVVAAREHDGTFTNSTFSEVLDQFRKPDAILVGPGMTCTPETCDFMVELFKYSASPLVLDADALNQLSWTDNDGTGNVVLFELLPPGSILTPHGGELERLFEASGTSDPATLAIVLQSIIVAKGPETVVYHPDSSVLPYVYTEGTAALAKAGTGDVLAGIIASLLAQGATNWQAATLGVKLHGLAGNLAEAATSRRAMTARDVIDHIAPALRELEGC
jgi:NAD(P)H-hydrate epimerase